jgi:hypothetical protein
MLEEGKAPWEAAERWELPEEPLATEVDTGAVPG